MTTGRRGNVRNCYESVFHPVRQSLPECRLPVAPQGDFFQGAVDEENWLKIMAGETVANITWRGLPVQAIAQNNVARHFNFQPNPQP